MNSSAPQKGKVQYKKPRLSGMSFNYTNEAKDRGMWGYLDTCIMANKGTEPRKKGVYCYMYLFGVR